MTLMHKRQHPPITGPEIQKPTYPPRQRVEQQSLGYVTVRYLPAQVLSDTLGIRPLARHARNDNAPGAVVGLPSAMANVFQPDWDEEQNRPPFSWKRARLGRQLVGALSERRCSSCWPPGETQPEGAVDLLVRPDQEPVDYLDGES